MLVPGSIADASFIVALVLATLLQSPSSAQSIGAAVDHAVRDTMPGGVSQLAQANVDDGGNQVRI
jgi:hypothetical protein